MLQSMKSRRTRILAHGITTIAFAAAFATIGPGASAHEPARGLLDVPASASMSLDAPGVTDLESVFWACDYIATTRGHAHVDNERCQASYEALKQRKFGGQFELLLHWWQSNKPAQHERMRTTAILR